jgi:hypothetical protein
MLNNNRRIRVSVAFAFRPWILLFGLFTSVFLVAPKLSAQVTANPAYEIFTKPGATAVFSITVPSGTNLGSFSVLTLGAPNLDYTSVPAGTTCPNVVAGTCTIEVQFQPTAPGRRHGAVLLNDPSGKLLLAVSLTGAGNKALAGFAPGIISTFAGRGTSGDGRLATSAQLAGPTSVAVDGFSNHYIADPKDNKIRKVTAAGIISTFAGTGTASYSGDGGPATSAQLNGPMAVLVDGAGLVYIADTGNNVVRRVNPDGMISTYAGQYYAPGTTPPPVCNAATNSVGDGCPGNQIVLNTPVDMVFCVVQNLHIADKLNNRVRTVLRTTYRTITQVGNGVAGYNGDGGLSTSSEINGPTSMAMDAANYIYIADSGNHIIRKTLLTGTTPNPISTVAGTPGSAGKTGDGGPAINAQLNNPVGVRVDPAGDIYISDSDSQVIREVNAATGKISTIVGTGSSGGSGDGGQSSIAQLNVPVGLLLDEIGNLYIADSQNAAIRKVNVFDAPSLNFASTTVGTTSAPQDVTVTNLGNSPLTISQITASTNYSVGGPDTSCSLSSSQTLNPAASCVLSIEFSPATAGNLNGSVVLNDDSNPTSQKISLTGSSAVPTETYTLAVNTPTVSMTAGGSGTDTLTLKSNNYSGTITFVTSISSTDGTPANVTATASSVTLTPGGSVTSTVTISANASATNHTPSSPWNGGGILLCTAFIVAPFAFRRKRLHAAFPLLLAVFVASMLMACGAVGSSTDPPVQTKNARTFIVTVTPTGAVTPAGSATVTNPSAVTIQVTVQ